MFPSKQIIESHLALYFKELTKGVHQIEILKGALTQQDSFDPYLIFYYLSSNKPYISVSDLMSFIEYNTHYHRNNNLQIGINDVQDIFRQHSIKYCGELSYSELCFKYNI